ncbi:acyltransferase [Maribacter sp. 2-571]|uniref:acyltransferase n=1 Tax=Maribacter sp. 2-571 TaxID=3417569 RepID=UPI003D350649
MKKVYLLIYYLFAQYLPMQPIPGYKIFYKIRYLLCKKLLLKCGDNVIVKNRCYFGNGSKLRVGDFSQLGQNARISGPVTLGKYVMMGPDVVIMAVTHDISDNSKPMIDPSHPSLEKAVVINDNVWIGTRVVILPGVEIGEGSIIGSGAVVTKSFGPNSVIGGVPARFIKNRV